MTRCYLVLGMHRSGTSAVTGSLLELGVELGDGLMPGRPGHNVKGYFESDEIVDFDDLALEVGGSSWQSLFAPPALWFESADALELGERLRGILVRRFGGLKAWAVKDPRLCRLLPLWIPVVDGWSPRFVLVHRDPAEVAASLASRNGFSFEKSAWLWLDHTLSAERETRGRTRGFVGYRDLLRDPAGELDRLAAALDTEWPRRAGAATRLADFVDPALHHQSADGTRLDGPFGTLAKRLHDHLESDAGGAGDSDVWDSCAARFRELRQEHDPLLAEHAVQSAIEVRRTLREIQGTLDERTLWIGRQSEEIEQQAVRLQAAEERVAALQRQLRAGEQELARQTRIALDLSDRLDSLDHVDTRDLELSLEASVARLGDQLQGEIQAQRTIAEHARSLAEMLWMSKPWRLYLWLGRLKGRLSGRRSSGIRGAASGVTAGRTAPPRVAREIGFRACDSPVVSIVIPVFNQFDFTWQCLDSIARTPTEVEYEVIVVDDLSTDATRERLAEVANLRLVCKEENTGFIGSCNRGAEEARGEYVLFLNNDTMVTAGWLDELLRTFQAFNDVGLVGGKLVFPDGSLQEAGGIVWRDGSAWNFGRGKDPDAPEYSYAREVDYCSGACLMIPRDLFMELGMFDRHFAPAYYEDVDLAFKVRAAGKRVLYQPHCRITHFEGMSCGTDLKGGVKQYQVENGKRFFERWQKVLASHRANGVQPEHEKERRIERRFLIIDHRIPTPDQDAGSLRMWGIAEILRDEGWKVTIMPDNLDPLQPYTRRLQATGIEVVYTPFVRSVRGHLEKHGSLYDVVLLSRVHVAGSHIDLVRRYCPQATVLFDTVDLHFVREMRHAELEGDSRLQRKSERTRDLELSVARRATKTIVVSEYDAEVIREFAPQIETCVVSTIYDVEGTTREFDERTGALFIGGFEHTPNVDAATWLVREIVPLVLEALPQFHLTLVGSKPPAEVLDLASDHVTVTGFVPSVDPYLDRCRLSVAPLRFGSGVKGKMNQSMAHGLPCVATTLACEGMGLRHEVDVIVADTTEEIAEAIVRLHEDEALWRRVSEGGMANIEEHFSMAVARRRLLAAIDSAAAVGAPR